MKPSKKLKELLNNTNEKKEQKTLIISEREYNALIEDNKRLKAERDYNIKRIIDFVLTDNRISGFYYDYVAEFLNKEIGAMTFLRKVGSYQSLDHLDCMLAEGVITYDLLLERITTKCLDFLNEYNSKREEQNLGEQE